MNNIITAEQTEAIREYFATHTIPRGVGSENSACTIAAINLQLTGKLSDELHPCMSPVIRRWVIRVQDSMPSAIRNSEQWKAAAVGIAGSASAVVVGPSTGIRRCVTRFRRDIVMRAGAITRQERSDER